jgi:hypothetical protein
MLKLLTFLAPLLKRVLSTNKFTSIGATLALVSVVLLLTKHLSETNFLAMLATSVTIIGYASKDGVRSDSKVAPEDVPPFPPLPPTGAAVVLLLFAVGLLAGCSSIIFHKATAAAQVQNAPLSHHFGSARPVRVPLADADLDTLATKQVFPPTPEVVAAPDSIDLPPAFAGVPEAPYLVAPPAYLSARERRKFLRVQQRAQRHAVRAAARTYTGPAKVKLGKGAAYNAAPAGTATTLKNTTAPVALGPKATATDNSTKLPEPTAWQRFTAWLSTARNYLFAGLAVVGLGFVAYLRFSPFGRAVRGAASLARSTIASART